MSECNGCDLCCMRVNQGFREFCWAVCVSFSQIEPSWQDLCLPWFAVTYEFSSSPSTTRHHTAAPPRPSRGRFVLLHTRLHLWEELLVSNAHNAPSDSSTATLTRGKTDALELLTLNWDLMCSEHKGDRTSTVHLVCEERTSYKPYNSSLEMLHQLIVAFCERNRT